MSDLTSLAQTFANTMTGRMRSETDYHTSKTMLGRVVSVRGADAPVVQVGKQKLKRTSYRIAKSVSVANLKPGDEVLMVETYLGTLVMTALMRTDSDKGDRNTKAPKTKSVSLVGNGSSVTFDVEHQLGTRDIAVSIWDANTNELYYDKHDSIVATDSDTVRITFKSAPTTKQYRIVIK